jgi:hypothetical protein
LFSAILTAFVIESYQSLTEDFSETSARLLYTVSIQLSQQSAQSGSTTSVVPQYPTFTPSSLAIALNALWFTSLILSISAVFGGIVMKQSLREYITWTSILRPKEALRLRQSRYEALTAWGAHGLVTLLPALVQAATILFVVGLPMFLWTSHPVVASIVIAIVSLLLCLIAIAFLAPALFPDCPLKSPISWVILQAMNLVFCSSQVGAMRSRRRKSIANPTWKQRDLSRSKDKARHNLWRFLMWTFEAWNEHYLSNDLQTCAQDLLSRDPEQKPHIFDAVNEILDEDQDVIPLLLISSGIPADVLNTIIPAWHPRESYLHDSMNIRRKIGELPPPMLIMLCDWLIRDAHRSLDSSPEDIRTDRTLAVFCFLECVVDSIESAAKERLLRSWFGLSLHVFKDTFEPQWLRVESVANPWMLRDMICRWFERRQNDVRIDPNDICMFCPCFKDWLFYTYSFSNQIHPRRSGSCRISYQSGPGAFSSGTLIFLRFIAESARSKTLWSQNSYNSHRRDADQRTEEGHD